MEASRLADIPLFADLSSRERKRLARHADEVDIAPGTTFIDEGRLAHELFVIREGSADVYVDGELVRSVGPGDILGEIGVLETHKRTATVVARSPVTAVVFYAPELTAMQSSMPDLFDTLRQSVRDRLGDAED